MEKQSHLNSIILGAATSVTIGNFLFQALGTLILGIIGALGGYIFTRFIKPLVDAKIKRIREKLNRSVEK